MRTSWNKRHEGLVREDVEPIYKKNYWDRMKCDDVPRFGLSSEILGVNAGTGRSAKYLQRMIGTVADGGIGPNTLKCLDEYIAEHGVEDTIRNFQLKTGILRKFKHI